MLDVLVLAKSLITSASWHIVLLNLPLFDKFFIIFLAIDFSPSIIDRTDFSHPAVEGICYSVSIQKRVVFIQFLEIIKEIS